MQRRAPYQADGAVPEGKIVFLAGPGEQGQRGFCPTGPGGGVDPTCGSGGSGAITKKSTTEQILGSFSSAFKKSGIEYEEHQAAGGGIGKLTAKADIKKVGGVLESLGWKKDEFGGIWSHSTGHEVNVQKAGRGKTDISHYKLPDDVG